MNGTDRIGYGTRGACECVVTVDLRGLLVDVATDQADTATASPDRRDSSVAVAKGMWSAIGSMSLCVALLIAAEFMPVSLLTPIADDLGTSVGMAGQGIAISGIFAVLTSLSITTLAARLDRRYVLLGMTGIMLLSLIMTAVAPSFLWFMIARALLGVVIGGFWSLATATVMRLVPSDSVPKALAVVFTGNAVATAFAAPIGSYLGGVIGWRGVFWAFVPLVVANFVWQWIGLPSLPSKATSSVQDLVRLVKRPSIAFGIVATMLTFGGAFCAFTYFRPFLETRTHATVTQLSVLLLGLGAAGFIGTYGASKLLVRNHLYSLLGGLPLALGSTTLLLLAVQHSLVGALVVMIMWGALNSAIPVAWSSWLAKNMNEEAESGGGLMVAATQLAIMLGAALGGYLLDQASVTFTFVGGALLLYAAAIVVRHSPRMVSGTAVRVTSNDYAPSHAIK